MLCLQRCTAFAARHARGAFADANQVREEHKYHRRRRACAGTPSLPPSPQPSQQELALEGAGNLEVLLQGGHKAGQVKVVGLGHNVLRCRRRPRRRRGG